MKFNLLAQLRALRRPTAVQFILMGAGLLLGILLLIFLNNFVACWSLTSLAGIPASDCPAPESSVATPVGSTPVAGATPTAGPGVPEVQAPPPWDGASRVTVLVIGLDYRDWEANTGAPRSDSMILLTIDPVARTAGMISVPRDMWVNIPGFGYSKINNAYSFGEGYHLPGGGPGLAMKTVENFLGVKIDYYVQVDFLTFEKMIDTIGGICLDVPSEIRVGRTFTTGITLQPGYQCLDGKTALGYARERRTENGDVDRAARQQQVILAIRDKILQDVPGSFSRAPQLYADLSGGIHTNMSLNAALSLAWLAKDISLDQIQHGVIDYTMMQDGFYNLNGQNLAILRPFPDKIRALVDKIFSTGIQPMATGDPSQLMQAESASVAIVNGTGVDGMASRTSEYLKTQGMNVVGFGNTGDYAERYRSPFPDRTVIFVHMGRPYAQKYLMDLMHFNSESQIVFDFNPDAPADLVVALGHDWGNNNPLP